MVANYFRIVVFAIVIAQTLSEVEEAVSEDVIDNSEEIFPRNVGKWSVSYPGYPKSSCVLLKGAIQLQFLSTPGNNKTFETIDVPTDAFMIEGICDKLEQSIVLVWPWPINKPYKYNELMFNFTLQPNSNHYYIEEIAYGVLQLDAINNTTLDESGDKGYLVDVWSSGEFYSSTQNHSYSCKKEQKITGDLNILTSDFQYEAFRILKLKSNIFDAAENCKDSSQKTPTTTTTANSITSATTPAVTTTTGSTTTPNPSMIVTTTTGSTTTSNPSMIRIVTTTMGSSTTLTPSTTTGSTTTSNPSTAGSTTTLKPSTTVTTTTASPTTTSQPLPVEPFPKNVGNWSYEYESNPESSCILLLGAFQLQYYTTPGNKDSHNVIDVPKDAKVQFGNCKNRNQTQLLILTWTGHDANAYIPESRTSYIFAVNFTIDSKDEKHYFISEVFLAAVKNISDLEYLNAQNYKEGVNGYIFATWTEGELYRTSLSRSFACITRQTIAGNLTVVTADLEFEAFRPLNLAKYELDEAKICQADLIIAESIVGIVVGSVIAILFGLCIGAYLGIRYGLFGKIRSRFRRNGTGYQPLHTDT